jgi:hypothetical protein
MGDRVSEVNEAQERAREFDRAERNTAINQQIEQIERLGRALAQPESVRKL